MKGNVKLVQMLNRRLAEELTAISQYMVHSEMCANWGFEKLHKAIEHQAFDEMHHAEWLIARIIFFEGTPVVSKLDQMHLGKNPRDIILNDLHAEVSAVKAYNDTIQFALEVGDNATRDLLAKILAMEEGHLDWAEQQRDQIEQMGIENYLTNQTGGAAS